MLLHSCQQNADDFGLETHRNIIPNNLFVLFPRTFAVNASQTEALIPFNQKSLLLYNYETNKIVKEFNVDTAKFKEIYAKTSTIYPQTTRLDPLDAKRSKYSSGLIKFGEISFSEKNKIYEVFTMVYFPYQEVTDTATVNIAAYKLALLAINKNLNRFTYLIQDTLAQDEDNLAPEFPFFKTNGTLYATQLGYANQNDSIPLLAKYNIDKSDSLIKYNSAIDIFYNNEIHQKGNLTLLLGCNFQAYNNKLYYTEGNYIYNLNALEEKITPNLSTFKIVTFMLSDEAVYTVLKDKAAEKCNLVKWNITMTERLNEKALEYSPYTTYKFTNRNLYSINFNENKEVIFTVYNL